MTARSAIVVGGGLAGIAAAVRLADHGLRVTLVETRKRLGGRATSFVDPQTGQLLDNCQHVLMGCCTNLLDLYARLGVADRIAWHDRLYFCDGVGRIDMLEPDDLPAPVHYSAALLHFKGLSLADKVAIARGMLAMMRLDGVERGQWHERTFTDWLRVHRQTTGAIRKFWSVIIISALNELPERVAADYAIQVFRDGFLCHEDAARMGLPNVPLVQLYDAAERVLVRAGGNVMLSTSAEAFTWKGGRVASLRVDGGRELTGDVYVSALPFDRLAKVCPPEMVAADARLQSLDAFTVSPIIGIHVWLDRPVMQLPHLILTESPLQWIFNKGVDQPPVESDSPHPAQHLHGVISAAHDLVDHPTDAIADLAVREIRSALGPDAANVNVLHHRVVKEKRATFSARPGIEALRPAAAGPIPGGNLFLAGDWCRTGWPATMEGATRGGYQAANTALESLGLSASDLTPGLPHSSLYDLLSRQ